MERLGKLLVLSACIAYPFVLHFFVQKDDTSGWPLLLVILPLLVPACWMVVRAVSRIWWPLVTASFFALGYFIVTGDYGHIGLVAVNAISHASFNLFLLWFFARTLRDGSEPLITQISRRINGGLDPAIVNYTRRVTIAWCVFFAVQVVVSALLYLFAPLAAWSTFVNVLNLPLLILMFACEYAYRIRHYPNHAHASILKVIEVYAKDIAVSQKTDS
jgi:uncharacterized membrane protein